MADAVVKVACDKLTNALVEQVALFAGAVNELQKIQQSLKHIETVLHVAVSRQLTDKRARLWLSELRQVAYDIEDLIDERLENDESDGRSEIEGCADACLPSPFICLSSPFAYFHHGVSCYQLGRSVREIRQRLDQIDKLMSQRQMYAARLGSFEFTKEKMIGRVVDEIALLRRLLRDADSDEDEKAMLLSRLLLNVVRDDDKKAMLLSRLLHDAGGDDEEKAMLLSRLLHDAGRDEDEKAMLLSRLLHDVVRDEDEKVMLLSRLLLNIVRDDDKKVMLLSRLLLNVVRDDDQKAVLLSRLLHDADGDDDRKAILLSRLLDDADGDDEEKAMLLSRLLHDANGDDEEKAMMVRRLLHDADWDEDEKSMLLSRLLLNVVRDDDKKVVLLSRLLLNVDGDDEEKAMLLSGLLLNVYRDDDEALSRLLGGLSSTGDFDGLQQQQLVGENSSKQQQLASASSGSGGEDGRLQLVGESSSPWKEDWQQKQLMGASSSITGNKNGQQQLQLVGASTITGNEDGRQQQQGNVVPVIAILGIGGQGKTTLARKIYKNPSVQVHFKNALYWVDVSENFDEEIVIKAIIKEVKRQGTSLSEPQALKNELIAALRGKRFLLVLDNLWNIDESKWNTLQRCLASGAAGSRILVTTRLNKVAQRTTQAAYIHHLKGLPDIDSWKLFKMIALKGWDSHKYEQLESARRDIASKCSGVPLSIKVMGSLMNSKATIKDWLQNILDGNIWSFTQVQDGILPALWPSYHNLPPHLKPCFVYCSIYQKGSVMCKDELVRMWIAQGFVRPEGNREREAIGDEYFNELVEWSMLEPDGKNSQSEIISCTMHDLLHDLARFIAKDEIYTTIITNKDEQLEQRFSNNARHECIYFTDNHDKLNATPIVFGDVKKLRTIWINGVDGLDDVISDILHRARLLRALVLRGSDSRIMKLPSAIGKMKHLRYLDVSGLNIEELPEAVSHLHNLHSLNVTRCRQLKKLPSGIGNMAGLRHIEIKDTDSLEYLPRGLGKLSSLRSLCKFIVGGGEGGGCNINELQRLNSLQEILEIEHLERVSTKLAAEEAQLFDKKHLHRLVLRTLGGDVAENERTKSVVEGQLQNGNLERMLEGLWHHGKLEKELEGLCAPGNLEEVFEGLRPHINLFELELCRYTGSKLPKWIAQLPHLMILRLRICPMLKGLLHHEGLGSLQELMVEDCDAIEGLERCSVSFCGLQKITLINSSKFFSNGLPNLPNLKTLEIIIFENETLPTEGWERLEQLQNVKIKHCKALSLLPEGFDHFRGLQGLSIDGCPLLSQRCMKMVGADWPKICHIPNICIDGKFIQKIK